MAEWQSGHAADCKSVNAGSIPTSASNKKIILKYQVHLIKGDIFFSLFASDSFYHREIKNLPFKRRAETKEILLGEIKNSFNKMPRSHSISYTKMDAAICFAFDDLKLGIDIERKDRFLNNSLLKKIKIKAKKLDLKYLEYLCLLESSFKSKKINRDDLESYSFRRDSEIIILNNRF